MIIIVIIIFFIFKDRKNSNACGNGNQRQVNWDQTRGKYQTFWHHVDSLAKIFSCGKKYVMENVVIAVYNFVFQLSSSL